MRYFRIEIEDLILIKEVSPELDDLFSLLINPENKVKVINLGEIGNLDAIIVADKLCRVVCQKMPARLSLIDDEDGIWVNIDFQTIISLTLDNQVTLDCVWYEPPVFEKLTFTLAYL